jgi:hypothetical protein
VAVKTAESDPLRADIEAYCAQLGELLKTSAGKYVVFAHSRLFAECETLEAALKQGYREFGRKPFLVQRVESLPTQVDFHLACRA